jgi:hypothetical protein
MEERSDETTCVDVSGLMSDDALVLRELKELQPIRFKKGFKFGLQVMNTEDCKRLVRVKRLGEGVVLDGLLEAKAFVSGLSEIEADRLLRACVAKLEKRKVDMTLNLIGYQPIPKGP